MPIQIEKDKFVQFKFQPKYLLEDPVLKDFVTNIEVVHKRNAFLSSKKIIYSNLILDGGNIVKWKNKVIITEGVLTNNPEYSRDELTKELGNLLNAEIILIPAYPNEPTGHSDGLVRFVDENSVLTFCLDNEELNWKSDFLDAMHKANLQVNTLPHISDKEDEYSWGYLNFLQVKGLIIMPFLRREGDEMMRSSLKQIFPDKIEKIFASRIIENGGVLNCFTWNIFE
jgi:agmatine deiminase